MQQDARRKAAWACRPWVPMMPPEIFGPWQEPWPQAVRGDAVRCFDEVSAARGGLGRFPGSQLMGLAKEFAGRRHEDRTTGTPGTAPAPAAARQAAE